MYLCNLHLFFNLLTFIRREEGRASSQPGRRVPLHPPLTPETQHTILGMAVTHRCLHSSVAAVSGIQRPGASPLSQSLLDSWIADESLLEREFGKHGSRACCVPGHMWRITDAVSRRVGGRGDDLYICALRIVSSQASSVLLVYLYGKKHAVPAPRVLEF